MNSKVFMVVRILLAIMLLVFGTNKFFNFLPPFEVPQPAQDYFAAMASSKTLHMVGIVEVLAGLALLINRYGALMAVILMSISVNAVLFHATLAPEGIGPALGLLILNILVLVGYKDRYKDILRA
ncbi:DoxX family protein [Flagellimonas allohymeniacidonis]|uniref:DoxX family protein n=1 Tax=Flagellimonas allohymeniacidonis TaxID=2517819 RepID=A0A4Q8QGS4_9FLAO|nr:DoxX family protein [Allomuricauda hymeniacidonis]TAI49701.1 DoxX family protein [Allomuricauda hymeniacidonis]